ncbi:uncharacterized protein ColSpa_01042 [Colletotrichum spaethianum]|uniref:Uncharacterized protein n=1 Tax=Colletotrichum spaethianum TaxID=700344 RepID=A0AA37L361_9PEZI|nr:uncharacterized protein ColSpa_01042 [Colletotrichum spaethianum]GKT40861.1 hypothetical protein ColSpa_01042 [Colletotrichum spaethianum]
MHKLVKRNYVSHDSRTEDEDDNRSTGSSNADKVRDTEPYASDREHMLSPFSMQHRRSWDEEIHSGLNPIFKELRARQAASYEKPFLTGDDILVLHLASGRGPT